MSWEFTSKRPSNSGEGVLASRKQKQAKHGASPVVSAVDAVNVQDPVLS
jgi:hypothetical protein